jgi:hypothetical protein
LEAFPAPGSLARSSRPSEALGHLWDRGGPEPRRREIDPGLEIQLGWRTPIHLLGDGLLRPKFFKGVVHLLVYLETVR